jgi:hypothetical protein
MRRGATRQVLRGRLVARQGQGPQVRSAAPLGELSAKAPKLQEELRDQMRTLRALLPHHGEEPFVTMGRN